ncbi:Uncharacterised protein [Mycobacterium tuberculosis]|nr:Uncharacterised protein [Mycobacterium tuberculosis]
MEVFIAATCTSMSSIRSFMNSICSLLFTPCMLMMNGIEVCLMVVPKGRVIAFTCSIPGLW